MWIFVYIIYLKFNSHFYKWNPANQNYIFKRSNRPDTIQNSLCKYKQIVINRFVIKCIPIEQKIKLAIIIYSCIVVGIVVL